MTDSIANLRAALAGRYNVGEKIGEGGMALVYSATDLKHDRAVAIKVLRPEIAARMAGKRFLAEIRVTARLQHPNALPLFDSGEEEGQLYFVMPLVEGETLGRRLAEEGALSPEEAFRIAADVAGALDHAHEMGVVHRDVKPGNILLSHGRAVIGDFGIALATQDADADRLTRGDGTPGSSVSMSPEQVVGEEVDARSDVYSLGCVVYEMLTGRPPFTGSTDGAVRVQHVTEDPPSIRSFRGELSPELDRVVQWALSKDPEDRPQTAGEFARALAESRAPGRRRGPALVWAIPALLVALVAGGLWIGRGSPPDAGALQASRVMIFPLVVSDGVDDNETMGEDVATLVGNALDGLGPLRWIDGWSLLDDEAREDIRRLGEGDAREIAAARGSGYYVTGRVLGRGDSVEVLLDLSETGTGEIVARGSGRAPGAEAWQGGLAAVVELLPALVPGTSPEVIREWRDRDPLAIASFVLGEAAFRRVEMSRALGHYRDALNVDPEFAVAAIRGAQAATWAHDPAEAESLIASALAVPLPERYRRFARGFDLYLQGRADSAAHNLEAALDLDPEFVVAWMQLGEVYTHLLPLAGSPDSLADRAFARGFELDSSAVSLLLHPIETRLRTGDLAAAEPLLRRFRAGSPEPTIAGKLRIMEGCLREGSEGVAWPEVAAEEPLSLLFAAQALAGSSTAGGVACSRAAYEALLEVDTAATAAADGRRFPILVGTFAGRVARGEVDRAIRGIDDFVDRWGFGSTLFLLAAPVVPGVVDRALEIARDDQGRWGRDYAGARFPIRLWELGLLEVVHGDVAVAARVGEDLARRAAAAPPDSWDADYVSGLARSVQAFVTLARGDTAQARRELTALVEHAPVRGQDSWDEALPRALERLTLARLNLEAGNAARAIGIASVFDSTWPMVHALYLPPSLELRRSAAERLGDGESVAEFDRRLHALGGTGGGSG